LEINICSFETDLTSFSYNHYWNSGTKVSSYSKGSLCQLNTI